jgi:formiminotetrahydrofolate cyclodeaminase
VSAAFVLHAAVGSALANVEINAASLKDAEAAAALRAEAEALRTSAADLLVRATAAFASPG